MESRAGGHFDSFQIQARALPLGREHYLENRLDLACNFLMNSRGRFFSASGQPAASRSAGRDWQICSLVAVNSEASSLKAMELGDFLAAVREWERRTTPLRSSLSPCGANGTEGDRRHLDEHHGRSASRTVRGSGNGTWSKIP